MSIQTLELTTPGHFHGIEEDLYYEVMAFNVEPYLETVKQSSFFSRESQKDLYYEKYIHPEAKYSIVLCHGYTESSEKFKELIYYFYQASYNVFTLDHQGHGKSHRLVNDYTITHVHSFDDYVKDLKAFVDLIVAPASEGIPSILYGHSMGGAIAGTYMASYPTDFDKGILSAPMFQIDGGSYPDWTVRLIAEFMTFIGKEEDRLFTHATFNPNAKFENSYTKSIERFNYYYNKCVANEIYQNSSPSYSWLKQSLIGSKSLLKKNHLAQIEIPVMVFQAEDDSLVRPEAQVRFVKNVRDAILVKVPESKHEIFMSGTKVLDAYMTKIFDFVEGQ